jgi:hypothetical protein
VTITDTGNEGNGNSRAMLAALTVSTCQSYVVPGLTYSSSPIVYFPDSKLYAQDVYLTNNNIGAVPGPVDLILEDLPAGVRLETESRSTACYAPIGSPYVTALPKGSTLAPNTTLVVRLEFKDPSGSAISYTPLTVSGIFGQP